MKYRMQSKNIFFFQYISDISLQCNAPHSVPNDVYVYIVHAMYNLKVLVASATLVYFLYFVVQYVDTCIHSPRVHFCFLCSPLRRGLPWSAVPGFELGPAVQQAHALLFELRRTLIALHYVGILD
jgi:hypothetical protein